MKRRLEKLEKLAIERKNKNMQQILIVSDVLEIGQHLHLLAQNATIVLDAWRGEEFDKTN